MIEDATRIPLQLTVDPWADRVEATAYGTAGAADVDGGRTVVAPGVELLHDLDDLQVTGFVVHGWSSFVPDDVLWGAPRFTVPVLGTGRMSIGEICLAIRGHFVPGEATADVLHRRRAQADEDPAGEWALALEAGCMAAHRGLGLALLHDGRPDDARDHLRHWRQLVTADAEVDARLAELGEPPVAGFFPPRGGDESSLGIATELPLHLTVDPWWELLEVVAFGMTTDGVDRSRWGGITEQVGLLYADDGSDEVVGFMVKRYAEVEVTPLEEDDRLHDLRFDVPVLGLWQASLPEILGCVQRRYGELEPTADALHQHVALGFGKDLGAALEHWRMALECGDAKAHHAVGYTLHGLGRLREAYAHLRTMTELAPENAWAWSWLGRVCRDLGWTVEARAALERAVQLEGDETDAPELLDELHAG